MRALRNERGTKRETANCGRIAVLTSSSGPARNGGNLPLRPDGGVVTQRTANPLPRRGKPPQLAQFTVCSAHGISRGYAREC
jgi:hypothetical protein